MDSNQIKEENANDSKSFHPSFVELGKFDMHSHSKSAKKTCNYCAIVNSSSTRELLIC